MLLTGCLAVAGNSCLSQGNNRRLRSEIKLLMCFRLFSINVATYLVLLICSPGQTWRGAFV